jgi:hypothetical protein
MAVRLDLDVIPATRRPQPVADAIREAADLRAKLRAAKEATATAERALADARQADIRHGASRVRSGQAVGAPGAQVTKAEQQLAKDQRSAAIIERAYAEASDDLAAAIATASPGWIDRLGDEQAQAHERAVKALADYEAAVSELRAAAGAAAWLASALADQRLDRPVRVPMVGARAWTSARLAANGEAFMADQVLGWARELLDPPAPPPQTVIAPDAATA